MKKNPTNEKLGDAPDLPKVLHSLDACRFIAAMGVVLWHWQHFYYNGGYHPIDFARESQPLYSLFSPFYRYGGKGVDFFFILSGFIFHFIHANNTTGRPLTVKRFVANRFSRLYPLHFATLLLVCILQYIYYGVSGGFFVYPYNDPYHFSLHLIMASNWGFEKGWSFNAPVWSVSVEVLAYAAFFITAKAKRTSLPDCALMSFAFALLYINFSTPLILKCLSLFYLGGAVLRVVKLISRNKISTDVICYATVILWITVLCHLYGSWGFLESLNLSAWFYKAFPPFILFPLTIASLAAIEIRGGLNTESVSWLGSLTYSSYLLHFPLQIAFSLLEKAGLLSTGFQDSTIALVLFIAFLLAASFLCYRHFEKPMQSLIRDAAAR